MMINVITNGLLLTPDVVDRLAPFGLNGVKITLDGDHDTHNRMRPLRGGQGTFDKIIENVRRVAGKCRISIGGNFDETLGRQLPGAARLPARAGVRRQARAGRVQADHPGAEAATQPEGAHPAHGRRRRRQAAERHVHDVGRAAGPASATTATSSTRRCRSCARKPRSAGSRPWTACTWARARSIAVTPTRSARTARSTRAPASPATRSSRPGTSTAGGTTSRDAPPAQFERLAAWKECDDCAFIPVCAGGCTVAAHTELGDMNRPNCHKTQLRSGRRLARARSRGARRWPRSTEA